MAWYNIFGIGKKQNYGATSQPARNQSSLGVTRNYGGMQGGNANLQPTITAQQLQPAVSPMNGSFGGGTSNPSAGGGASSRSAGGYGYAQAPVDPYAQQRQDVLNKLQVAQSAYDALTGAVQGQYATQAKNLKSKFAAGKENLNNQYQTSANTLTGAYQAKGLGDSSFAGNAQDLATKSYNTSLGDLNQQEQAGLGQIGQGLQTARAKYEAAKSLLGREMGNVGAYDASGLQSLSNQTDTILSNIAQEQAGLGSQEQNVAALTNAEPAIKTSTAQLQSNLQSIINSGAPDFAKNAIAKGLISQAVAGSPDQASYWNDYYAKLSTTGKV